MAEGGALNPQRVENPIIASTEFQILLQDLQSGKARLAKNSEGQVKTVYTRDVAHWDESRIHTIQHGGTNNKDIEIKVKIFIDVVNEMKLCKAPAGLVIDTSKAKVSEDGKYREGQEFECPELKEVLGCGSCAGDVVVVKDVKTGSEHALKTIMISDFSAHELRCWIKLNDSNFFPSLYTFYLDGNTIKYHMEKIKGVTFTDVIHKHMKKLRETRLDLVRPFSLTVFQGLLTAVQEIHYNEYVHRDLHSGNVLLDKETMTIKVLDFGLAEELGRGSEFNHSGLKADFLGALGLFLNLYAKIPFEGNSALEKRIKSRELEKVISQQLTQKDREDVWELILLIYEIISNPSQAGYGDPTPIYEKIENKIFQDVHFESQGGAEELHEENPNSNRSNNLTGLQDKMAELLKEVAIIFFPEMHSKVENVTLNDGQRQTEIEQSPEEGVDLPDEAPPVDPAELLTKLHM